MDRGCGERGARVQDRSALGSHRLRFSMQQPELRLIRYWVAVAEEANITRAAERLHISQPALSAAIKQLEGQLGVALLERGGRGVRVTRGGRAAGRAGARAARARPTRWWRRCARATRPRSAGCGSGCRRPRATASGRRCSRRRADGVPGVMLYPQEDTTGALLRDVRSGRLDLAVLFCPTRLDGVASRVLAEERAVVHLRADHPLAARPSVALEELAGETFLVAESTESGGFTARVLEMCRARGFEPATRPDPYPDLGLQAVREGLGVVVYVRGAFPPELPGSAFVPVEPAVDVPVHARLARGDPLGAGRGGPGRGVGVGRGKLPTTPGAAAGELVACSPDSSSAPRSRCASPRPPPTRRVRRLLRGRQHRPRLPRRRLKARADHGRDARLARTTRPRSRPNGVTVAARQEQFDTMRAVLHAWSAADGRETAANVMPRNALYTDTVMPIRLDIDAAGKTVAFGYSTCGHRRLHQPHQRLLAHVRRPRPGEPVLPAGVHRPRRAELPRQPDRQLGHVQDHGPGGDQRAVQRRARGLDRPGQRGRALLGGRGAAGRQGDRARVLLPGDRLRRRARARPTGRSAARRS